VTDPAQQNEPDALAAAPTPPTATETSSFEDQERAVGIDPDAPLPGERGLRLILFGFVALFGIPTVLGGGIAAGYPVIGIVLAIALGAICLLFARPRNRA
jgi:hypothetical protein